MNVDDARIAKNEAIGPVRPRRLVEDRQVRDLVHEVLVHDGERMDYHYLIFFYEAIFSPRHFFR